MICLVMAVFVLRLPKYCSTLIDIVITSFLDSSDLNFQLLLHFVDIHMCYGQWGDPSPIVVPMDTKKETCLFPISGYLGHNKIFGIRARLQVLHNFGYQILCLEMIFLIIG